MSSNTKFVTRRINESDNRNTVILLHTGDNLRELREYAESKNIQSYYTDEINFQEQFRMIWLKNQLRDKRNQYNWIIMEAHLEAEVDSILNETQIVQDDYHWHTIISDWFHPIFVNTDANNYSKKWETYTKEIQKSGYEYKQKNIFDVDHQLWLLNVIHSTRVNGMGQYGTIIMDADLFPIYNLWVLECEEIIAKKEKVKIIKAENFPEIFKPNKFIELTKNSTPRVNPSANYSMLDYNNNSLIAKEIDTPRYSIIKINTKEINAPPFLIKENPNVIFVLLAASLFSIIISLIFKN